MWQDVVGVQTYISNFEPLDRLLSLGTVVILGGNRGDGGYFALTSEEATWYPRLHRGFVGRVRSAMEGGDRVLGSTVL